MSDTAVTNQVSNPAPKDEQTPEDSLELGDLLVEDVSIDGMCGVY